MKKIIFRVLITILVAFLLFYFTLPAINLSNFGFYVYLFFIFMVYKLTGALNLVELFKNKFANYNKKVNGVEYTIVVVIFFAIFLINIVFSPMFNANKYANRIQIKDDTSFTDDIKEVDFSKLPLLDKNSSRKLGDRVMGQMPELVSQFYVSDLYTQISYNDEIIRVTPLEYADVIKWFTNKKDGVKGYIIVDSVDGSSSLVKLEKGMKYMPSALFDKYLSRHLRFSYPTKIFGRETFEIDDEGNPFWIIPTIKYVAVGLREEIDGVIILDPVTGDSKHYDIDKVPSWVDHVYDANLIIEQFDDWGKYQKGFINSLFGQKGVVQTTDGYNYISLGTDIYLYTGITSVSTDESNIGFILTNLRTKETHFYAVAGAEEYSAMDTAKGQVQHMNYDSTFPLLVNLNGRATYLLSLKDKAGLVKMYAFVDVSDYQKVVVTDSSLGIAEAARNYLSNVDLGINSDLIIKKEIKIKTINSAIMDGISYYYFTDMNNQKYKVSVKVNESTVPFMKNGDVVEVTYIKEKDLIEVITIKNK